MYLIRFVDVWYLLSFLSRPFLSIPVTDLGIADTTKCDMWAYSWWKGFNGAFLGLRQTDVLDCSAFANETKKIQCH
jgi:hypothetical protein